MKERNKGYVFIAIAGILWSTIGLFSNSLMESGLNPSQVAFGRLTLGCIFLSLYCAISKPNLLKISKKGLIYSIIIGFICQALFNLCYLSSIKSVGVSVAAVLLYTSPLFLAVFSKIAFKEDINKNKILSLILCFIGAILAVTGGKLDTSNLNPVGVGIGILSAIAYALMPIINKNALKENESITLLLYSFLFGALFMIPISNPSEVIMKMSNPSILFNIVALGLMPAALAYIFYMNGISKGVELSVAGVIASVELIFAQLIGWFIIGEVFSIIKLFGLLFMIVSAVVAIKGTDSTDKENVYESTQKAC